MKEINIYSFSNCFEAGKVCYYSVSLEYKKHFKYMQQQINNTTLNRCMLSGIIEALKTIKEPCMVTINTPVLLGIASWEKKRAGVNADLITILHNIAFEKSCILKFEVIDTRVIKMMVKKIK